MQNGDCAYQTSGKCSFIGMPFVCFFIPFVLFETSYVSPLVVHNYPLVENYRKTLGFSLMELMVTLVVAGILAALAAPSFRNLMQNQQLSGQANDFLGDLYLARSEAVKRVTPISICKSADTSAAAPTCDTTDANPWTSGRIVFVDLNGDGQLTVDEPILRLRQPLEGNGSKLNGDGTAAGSANKITFSGNGMTTLVPKAGDSENQLILCDNRGASEAFAIVVSPTGRPRIATKGTDMKNVAITAGACP
jgi:type IV fimbrial biogenesis protein FimT